MTLVSNDPTWWPIINANLVGSYFVVAASVGVMYDWGLTFGQEVELVWKQRWSLITVLYLLVRYIGIGYAVINILLWVPEIPATDIGCVRFSNNLLVQHNDSPVVSHNMYAAQNSMNEAVAVALGVIIITRLHAMYQRSRKVLVFLVATFLVLRIATGVITLIFTINMSAEVFVLSGTYQCMIGYGGDVLLLDSMVWILGTVWEILALCLAAWVAVKHFRELRQHSTRGIIDDWLTVLMKTHASYFASYVGISCFNIGLLSPAISTSMFSLESQIYLGFTQISQLAEMCVLGPRLILCVREYHAKLVADSDRATVMTSVVFQEHVQVSTSSSV
ncbi:hypothetical protein BDR03DRAFT_1004598 [Suillus americanus]|nr:hypothetical protein BDR03DRAFT_1004598 [Suillus americanus]